MGISDRLSAAHTRLHGALSLEGEEALTFAGEAVKGLIDWQPKPDKLALLNFEPTSAGQIALITLPRPATTPKVGETLSTATRTFRVVNVSDLGHVLQLVVSVS